MRTLTSARALGLVMGLYAALTLLPGCGGTAPPASFSIVDARSRLPIHPDILALLFYSDGSRAIALGDALVLPGGREVEFHRIAPEELVLSDGFSAFTDWCALRLGDGLIEGCCNPFSQERDSGYDEKRLPQDSERRLAWVVFLVPGYEPCSIRWSEVSAGQEIPLATSEQGYAQWEAVERALIGPAEIFNSTETRLLSLPDGPIRKGLAGGALMQVAVFCRDGQAALATGTPPAPSSARP